MIYFKGYKIEAPKLEFGDSKHSGSDYIIKPEYHKLASDYPSHSGAPTSKSQNDFLLKTSEYSHTSLKNTSDYLNKAGDNGYTDSENHLASASMTANYNEKYFHPKQF